jgi:FixJ family two-component response regulator
VAYIRVISIVDDDLAVGLATANLVRSLGWGARVFASAEAFLQSSRIADTACLITDVRMPGLSGVSMHARLLDRGYILPTIFVTAFPTATLRATVMASGALALLEKPLDANAIIQYLDQLLGAP